MLPAPGELFRSPSTRSDLFRGKECQSMKLQRGWRIHVIAGLSLVFLFGFVLTLFQSPQITGEAARNILPGMTVREVEDLLGPERDETEGHVVAPCRPCVRPHPSPRLADERRWISKRAVITVLVDRET